MPGQYVKENVIFTSRGCNSNCDFCLVRLYEGSFRPVPWMACKNPIIQDNNILQHEPQTLDSIFRILRNCGTVTFSGGLAPPLITEPIVYMLKQLKLGQIFLSCDTEDAIKALYRAVALLDLPRDKLRCYVLIGREPYEVAVTRLNAVYRAGCLPFAQLYQPPDKWIRYNSVWRELQRCWSRPAITKSLASKDIL